MELNKRFEYIVCGDLINVYENGVKKLVLPKMAFDMFFNDGTLHETVSNMVDLLEGGSK